MIRLATANDDEAILAMAKEFISFSPYADFASTTDNELRATIKWCMSNATIFVSENNGTLIGMLIAIIAPMWYAPTALVASEMAWWINTEHRRGTAAIRLVQAFENWAREKGAIAVCMSNLQVDNANAVCGMLNRMGYNRTEQTHTKRI
ncbi:MAG: GNAT family N-acetyltransferase [Caulobacteraceae bacterium]|nr:GNAT family N-acetyltransferase [Caulobacteraceae bacterium]